MLNYIPEDAKRSTAIVFELSKFGARSAKSWLSYKNSGLGQPSFYLNVASATLSLSAAISASTGILFPAVSNYCFAASVTCGAIADKLENRALSLQGLIS